MSLSGLLNQNIVVYNKTGYSSSGREVQGGNTTVNCRFQAKTKQRLMPNGSLINILALVFLPAGTSINIDDKVTYSGYDYKVFSIENAVDGTGNTNHIEVELIKWQQS